jgi:hypothetical protein
MELTSVWVEQDGCKRVPKSTSVKVLSVRRGPPVKEIGADLVH